MPEAFICSPDQDPSSPGIWIAVHADQVVPSALVLSSIAFCASTAGSVWKLIAIRSKGASAACAGDEVSSAMTPGPSAWNAASALGLSVSALPSSAKGLGSAPPHPAAEMKANEAP